MRLVCAWVKERADNDWEAIVNESWLLGYLSGLALVTNQNFLKGIDTLPIYLWMNNYCKKNPLENVADVAEDLFDELEKKKGF